MKPLGQDFLEKIKTAKTNASNNIHRPFDIIHNIKVRHDNLKLSADAYKTADQWMSPEKFQQYVAGTAYASGETFEMDTEDGNHVEVIKEKDAADEIREIKENKRQEEIQKRKNEKSELMKFTERACGSLMQRLFRDTLGQNKALFPS